MYLNFKLSYKQYKKMKNKDYIDLNKNGTHSLDFR